MELRERYHQQLLAVSPDLPSEEKAGYLVAKTLEDGQICVIQDIPGQMTIYESFRPQ